MSDALITTTGRHQLVTRKASWLTPAQAALLSDPATAQDIPTVTRYAATCGRRSAAGVIAAAGLAFINTLAISGNFVGPG
ncbi:MAG: hypothetical protein ABW000_23450 [Actinoplanes sp.]